MARAPTVADRMRAGRRARFVGRAGELELVRSAIGEPQPPFSVLFVHGPGGVGKTALLLAVADLCEAEGVPAARLDLRTIDPSPDAFTGALEELRTPDTGPQVLLLDTYEAAGPLDGWLRERFLPSLPGDTITIVAGRNAPDRRWLLDPGWQPLVRSISLRNLDPDDVREYLARVGIRPALHDRVLALTHGHPLAVSLLVEVLAQREAPDLPAELGAARDVVGALLDRFVQDVPTPRHRRALEVCAHARSTTEALLRDVLGGDAAELFAWLRRLSFVEEGPHGLFPHDVARDVLSADIRWRDPAGFAELHHAVRTHLLRRIGERGDDDQAVADFHFLHRTNPFTSAYWDWEVSRDAFSDHLRPGDAEAILAMTERHEGPESAAIAAHWLERHPQGFVVFRAEERPIGFALMLQLERIDAQDIARDPGAQAAWDYVHARRPPRPGGTVRDCRLFVDAEAYQAPSVSFTLVPVAHLRRIFGDPARDWDVLAPWSDPEQVAPLMSYIDFERAPEADFEVGGRRYAAFAHDWCRRGLEEWLDLLEAREIALGWEQPQAGPAPVPVLALSRSEFADAVRRALKELHRDAALATSPLLAARVVREQEGEGPDALRDAISDAVGALRADPRDAKLARALTRTYLRPAPTQEAAAELLGLPFSTYRRHLTRGVERVTELLWSWELYGRGEHDVSRT